MERRALDRKAALQQVEEYRASGTARSTAARIAFAGAGLIAGLVAVPLVVLLPEAGVPLLLLALRLLAVEFDWAARSYAYVIWRWEQVKAWYRTRSLLVRGLIVLALPGLAAALVWLLVHEAGFA